MVGIRITLLVLLIVVGLNLLIALVCCCMAWQIWQLRQRLANFADTLNRWENNTHQVLKDAPNNILRTQAGMAQTHNDYQALLLRLRRLRQILVLIGVGQRIWSRKGQRQRQQRRRRFL